MEPNHCSQRVKRWRDIYQSRISEKNRFLGCRGSGIFRPVASCGLEIILLMPSDFNLTAPSHIASLRRRYEVLFYSFANLNFAMKKRLFNRLNWRYILFGLHTWIENLIFEAPNVGTESLKHPYSGLRAITVL